MSDARHPQICVAIACGGTGGHLFPGLAVGRELLRTGCSVRLLVSPKEVDQQAVKAVRGMEVSILPAVGLQRGQRVAFLVGFLKSYQTARRIFRERPPQVVLGMGGFTSAPPILAGRRSGARTFLHESNTIPGRANRWLARVVDRAFVGFQTTVPLLPRVGVSVTGTPVREEFCGQSAEQCRKSMGLDLATPVLLVMGGSQGAGGINRLMFEAVPLLAESALRPQVIHLTGLADAQAAQRVYSAAGIRAVVFPFYDRMETALGAATLAISRAGASSLAELAAARLPSILIPFPAAADNHQYFNARAFEGSGAALLLPQSTANPARLVEMVAQICGSDTARDSMCRALTRWHMPGAAAEIARLMLAELPASAGARCSATAGGTPQPPSGGSELSFQTGVAAGGVER